MPPIARIASLALKVARGQPMREVQTAVATAGAGLEGGVPPSGKRGLTLLCRQQWDDVTRDLHTDAASLPWHTRRANLLLDVTAPDATAAPLASLAPLIGQTIRIGPRVVLRVVAETLPCEKMDALHAGLLNALKPDCRAGVYGRVLEGGPITVGDEVHVIAVTADSVAGV